MNLIDFLTKFLKTIEKNSLLASQVVLVVKNLPANAGDTGDMGLIPGWGRFPGGGHGILFLHSWLENPMDRGAWRANVHGVTKNQTQLKPLSTHECEKRPGHWQEGNYWVSQKNFFLQKTQTNFFGQHNEKDNQNFKIDSWELATSGKPHQVLPGPGTSPAFYILPQSS